MENREIAIIRLNGSLNNNYSQKIITPVQIVNFPKIEPTSNNNSDNCDLGEHWVNPYTNGW